MGRVGYGSKGKFGCASAYLGQGASRQGSSLQQEASARPVAARATREPKPWRKCPGPTVGQGGAGTGTGLMVPSCFSSPRLEDKVDFGIWIPLLYSRLLLTPALPLHLLWPTGKPCLPTSSTSASSPWASGSAAPSTRHLYYPKHRICGFLWVPKACVSHLQAAGAGS